MALYHFSTKVISRASGRSAIAAAAYRAARALPDEALGRTHDFRAKAGVVHSEILLPEGAPGSLADRATLWNVVERGEKRRDAQLAREIELALPRELPKAEAIALVRDFVAEQFVARGMVADLNVHWGKTARGEDQPHAHVMLSMREVGPDGFGKKQREWNDRALVMEWRERWAELTNERLMAQGFDLRVDHRSYAEQGIELEPQNKIGPAGARREGRGENAERAREHEAIARRNGERIALDPQVALEVLTRQQSTFTRRDLARLVSRQTADAEQFVAVMAKVGASPELVRLGEDGRGETRFTTRTMLQVEQRMEQAALALSERQTHRVAAERRVGGERLGDEQRLALGHVTRARDLCVVVGYAGTGKSTMLGEARRAWEASGYTVRGAALSGIAAEGLEAGAGIGSRTVHSLLRAWEQGFDQLGSRDVLVVDEAGMIGSRQMERLLSAARDAGAKVVLVGDPEQLQAIEAGAAFRAIAERVGAVEITEVRRQRDGWQQQATRELATGRTEEALGRYAAAGMVHGHETLEAARAALVAGWDAARRARPEATQIMLTYRRDDVQALNEHARAVRRAAGELVQEWDIQTERGLRRFAEGDRLYFLRNDRELGVKNGTLGTVERLEAGQLVVRLDGAAGTGSGRRVTVDLATYRHLDHGYAATIHKSQGVTVDQAHVLATRAMDRHAAYVGLTRHRDTVQLHWSRDEIRDEAALARVLSRERLKDTSLDYPGPASAESNPVRAYGERRGLEVPQSEIVVPERGAQTARRGLFGGLKLHVEDRPTRSTGLDRGGARSAWEEDDRLGAVLSVYARAWQDADRMRQRALPVLPHQLQALEQAGAALEAVGAGLARDARATLERWPGLAQAMEQPERRVTLIQAVTETRHNRLALEERARAALREWDVLEQGYQAVEYGGDERVRRSAGQKLEAFAKALKADKALDALLQERGRELGLEEGSQLERVVRTREVRVLVRDLREELRLTRERDLGLGL